MGLFDKGDPAGFVTSTRQQTGPAELRPLSLQTLANTMQGQYLPGSPGFKALSETAAYDVMPQVQSAFAGANRLTGSSLAPELATDAMARRLAPYIDSERNRMLQAPQVAQSIESNLASTDPYFENNLAQLLGALALGGSLFGNPFGGQGGGGLGGLVGQGANFLKGLFGGGDSLASGIGPALNFATQGTLPSTLYDLAGSALPSLGSNPATAIAGSPGSTVFGSGGQLGDLFPSFSGGGGQPGFVANIGQDIGGTGGPAVQPAMTGGNAGDAFLGGAGALGGGGLTGGALAGGIAAEGAYAGLPAAYAPGAGFGAAVAPFAIPLGILRLSQIGAGPRVSLEGAIEEMNRGVISRPASQRAIDEGHVGPDGMKHFNPYDSTVHSSLADAIAQAPGGITGFWDKLTPEAQENVRVALGGPSGATPTNAYLQEIREGHQGGSGQYGWISTWSDGSTVNNARRTNIDDRSAVLPALPETPYDRWVARGSIGRMPGEGGN